MLRETLPLLIFQRGFVYPPYQRAGVFDGKVVLCHRVPPDTMAFVGRRYPCVNLHARCRALHRRIAGFG